MSIIKGKTNTGLVTYAKAQLGLPYWYGTFGQIATESLYKSKAKQYASTGYYTKWNDYPAQYGKRVHDCVGLVKGYMWSASPTSAPKYSLLQDKSAAGMYSASKLKGEISSFPAHVGQLVYKSSVKTNAKKIHHVGIYVGDGFVIEAKGHEEGVVKTSFVGAGWTHWSQCPYITDDTQTGGTSYTKSYEGTYSVTGGSVYIREGAGTDSKILGVLLKGNTVTCSGYFTKVSSTVWLKVSATLKGNAVTGWMSTKYLKKI